MWLDAIGSLPKLHVSPMAVVQVGGGRVLVEVDDVDENRIRLVFQPYQAVRITTTDCFDVPDGPPMIAQTVLEVIDSPWIEELAATLKRVDHTATFMTKARHFIVPAQDDFVEVVAWDVSSEAISLQ